MDRPLYPANVRRVMSDMKTLSMRDLNRKTAAVLDAVERGETFELRRNGKALGYITQSRPAPQSRPDWKGHFDWLRKQPRKAGLEILAEFEEDRRRQRAREKALTGREPGSPLFFHPPAGRP